MKYAITLLALVAFIFASGQTRKQEYYEIRTYQLANVEQEKKMDSYLKDALMRALYKAGITRVGVFKPLGNDTAAVRKIMVLIPYKSLNDVETIDAKLEKDKAYVSNGAGYINASHDNPYYSRYSRTILKAFSGHPAMTPPQLTGPRGERIYELRSYESATEKLYKKKVDMFVKGDEIAIFDKLKFNHIFYGEVIAGAAMPNLMYMTSFDNMQSRDEHWKAFGEDADWNKLKSDKQYDNTVSHIDITFLNAAEYSDL